MKKKTLIAILAGLAMALLIVLPVLFSGGAASATSSEETLQRFKESVKFVLHMSPDGVIHGAGTAFVINGEGNLVTNAHVVCQVGKDSQGNDVLEPHSELDYIYIIYEKSRRNRKVVVMQRARVLDYDRSRDLALLKVSDMTDRAEFKPLAIASSCWEGQRVMALGYPGSYDRDDSFIKFTRKLANYIVNEKKSNMMPSNRVELDWDVDVSNLLNCVSTDGSISQRRDSTGMNTGIAREASLDVLVHTATVQPGMSGGPLINSKGYVVGVNYAHQKAMETNNSAIDASEVLHFVSPRDGSLEDVVIVDKNPDSIVYTIRTKLNNAEPHEIVITMLCSVVILGALVTVFMVMARGKRRPARRLSSRPSNLRTDSNTPGNNEKTTKFEDDVIVPADMDAGHTIPMGRTPGLLFTGIDPNGKALRYRIPFKELQNKRKLMIGRSESCSIRLDSEYQEVSRQHACISYEEDAEGNGYLYISDQQATNPTLVNGVPLREKCLLMDGDELTFACITLTFKLD